MYILVILIILDRHLLLFIIALRYFQEIQSELGVEELLYLYIVFLNSSLEKIDHYLKETKEISFNNHMFTY